MDLERHQLIKSDNTLPFNFEVIYCLIAVISALFTIHNFTVCALLFSVTCIIFTKKHKVKVSIYIIIGILIIPQYVTLTVIQPLFPSYKVDNQSVERVSDVKESESNYSFVVKMNGYKYFIFTKENPKTYLFCKVSGEVSPIKRDSSIYNYAKSQKIIGQLSSQKLNCEDHKVQLNITQQLRDSIKNKFSYIYGQHLGNFYFLLFFGGSSNQEVINDDMWQQLGLIHLISLSTLQISFIIFIVRRLLCFLPVTKKTQKNIINLLLGGYLLICWPAITFLRVLIVALFINNTCEDNCDKFLLHTYSIVIFLLIFPQTFFNAGFFYSSFLSLLLVTLNVFKHPNKLQNFIIYNVTIFIVISLVSAIFSIAVSPIQILINTFFIPIFEYILLPLIIIGILFPVFSVAVTQTFAYIQFIFTIINIYVFPFFLSEYHLFFITLFISGILLEIQLNIYKRFVKLFLLLSVLIYFFSSSLSYRFENSFIEFLDVGQGDSSIIYLKECHQTILVDTGKPSPKFEKLLTKTLQNHNLFQINTLILTHSHSDHYGNAINLIENKKLKIETIIIPSITDANFLKIEKAANLNKINVRKVFKNDKIECSSKIQIEFLNPGYNLSNINEDSIVFKLNYGVQSLFFQGDAGVEFEESYAKEKNTYEEVLLVKVGHHGSKTASSERFITALKPKYAIISSGKNNVYRHPHEEVLKRYIRLNSTVLRTDQRGNILFTCTTFCIINNSNGSNI